MLKLFGISRRDGGDLDGIHLLWTPPYPTGYFLNGVTIQRRPAIQAEHIQCFDLHPNVLERARRVGFVDVPEARIWASPTDQAAPDAGPWTYRIDLRRAHHVLTINAPGALCGFAAHADGTVVDGKAAVSGALRFEAPSIAILWLVAPTPTAPFRICGDAPAALGWSQAETLVRDLQVPFRVVNPALSDGAEEEALGHERALPEALDGDFSELSRFANAAYAQAFDVPAWQAIVRDSEAERNNWDVAPLGFVLAASAVDPAWRRALGLGFLDQQGLTDGARYDYRITGHVPRSHRDETSLDFHTVPRGQRLPRSFRLGPLGVVCDQPPVVTAQEGAGPLHPLWKGIEVTALRLNLPAPASRVVIFGMSDGPIQVEALDGGGPVASLNISISGRTELDFGTPVQSLRLTGPLFLAGAIVDPLPAGVDPFEPVEVQDEILGIAFAPTAAPDPPSDVQAVNLGGAARTARLGHRDDTVGFEVSWRPPSHIDPAIMRWWPADARTATPTQVASYHLERSLDGGVFEAPGNTGGRHVASRNLEPGSQSVVPGADLLAVYPPANVTGSAEGHDVRAIDAFEGTPPAFGTEVIYGVTTMDAIGRSSARALAAPAQLRKTRRPPAPVGPDARRTAPPAEGEAIRPSGVQAILLEASDPDLTAAQRAIVDADGDVVVLRWGWSQTERDLDPLCREFRIYESAGRMAEITGEIMTTPRAWGGGWQMTCNFSRSVAANEFAGRIVSMGHAFEITGHGAGTSVLLEVAASVVDPAHRPQGAQVTLLRVDGSQAEPEAWDRRIATVARAPLPSLPDGTPDTGRETYEIRVPATWIAVAADRRRQIHSYGVSAADGEDYIPDRRAAMESAPRTGHESPVSPAEVIARYRGRPELRPAPLGPVTSVTLGRAAADTVAHTFTPADFLPSGADRHARMRVERAAASAILPRLRFSDAAVSLAGASGVETPWALSAADDAALRREDADRAVSDRFVAHAAAQLADLDTAFDLVRDADPADLLVDMLPNSPRRWVYRVRALDAGGRPSHEAQILELVVRVPQPARVASPQLLKLDLREGTAQVTLAVQPDAVTFVAHANANRLLPISAALSSIADRPDLPIQERFFVRDDTGAVLPLTPVTPAEDGSAEMTFTVPEGRHFHIWAFSVSPDGVPSGLVGPLHAYHGFPAETS